MRMRRHQRATASVLLLLTAVAFALTTSGLRGQVPLLINYQGRILSGSANFNGTGQFKFALLSPNGNFTYWTNDGTGGGSTQPTTAVSLTVTNGLYSILLGNTSIANMTALPTSVFRNKTDVVLRLWFNDGTHGFEQLSPDQQIAAVGYAMVAATVSSDLNSNTAVGDGAGAVPSGSDNTATGAFALSVLTSGVQNTACGAQALLNVRGGFDNTALGFNAGFAISSGSFNIMIGKDAGSSISAGSGNIDIDNAGFSNESNAIRIGTNQTTAAIAGISGASIGSGSAVFVNAGGRLGTIASSSRFKREVVDMGDRSDELLSMRPVSFRYKPEYDELGLRQFGLIAEEVEKVDPDLIVRDKEGKPYSVRYEQINAMLLNEFLKEHKTLAELETANEHQQQQIKELTAAVTKQAAELAKVARRSRPAHDAKE